MDFEGIRLFTQQVFHLQCLLGQWQQLINSYKKGSVHSSLSLVVSLELDHEFFSKFWYHARNPNELVHDRTSFFQKNFFCLKHWENGSKLGQKRICSNLLKNLVFDFHEIFSIMKTYFICCVSVHNLYLVRNLAPGIWTKILSANQIAVFIKE